MPLVSFVLAVRDGAQFLGEAVASILGQTVADLELIVVDDASADETPALLAALEDDRVRVLRNDEPWGLARSLNRALDDASGRYVARLDADDVAVENRLERQLARFGSLPGIAVVGSAVVDLDADGRRGRAHVLPSDGAALRWHALFSSPFFHPTVLVDRELLDRHGLRYDAGYLESEDYDLWTRLFAFADGVNLAEPLVLKRVHAAQASLRRSDVQESFQRRVALREIERVAPELDARRAELAWAVGSGRGVPEGERGEAGTALLELLTAFERNHGRDRRVRGAAARSLTRAGLPLPALRLAARSSRRRRGNSPHAGPTRVAVVSPEPTPYRAPLFDRIAARTELELTVLYAASSVADRSWSVEPQHRHVVLEGITVPGGKRVLRHDYPLTFGVTRELRRADPDVVVVSGWSTFAAQAATAWCRVRGVPYVLLVESNDLDRRRTWRRAVKAAVVPRLVKGAAGVLVVGSAARASVVAHGAAPERVRVFANTIDVDTWAARAARLPRERDDEDVVVFSAARLVPEKALDVLVRAVAAVGAPLRLVVAGAGTEREALRGLAAELDVRLSLTGELGEEALARAYVDADVFALLSTHEPWGVVVNEAAASELPLVLSDSVGAAHDLLVDGVNGFLVPSSDVAATTAALAKLASDPDLRRQMGRRSRELVGAWSYEPSVEAFVATVREATSR